MWMNTSQSFGAISKILHWLIATCVVAMIVLGFLIDTSSGTKIVHKDLGFIILCLMVIRVTWLSVNPFPKLPSEITLLEKCASHTVKFLLYAMLFIMPLSGWIMSSIAGYPPTFGHLKISAPFLYAHSLMIVTHSIHIIGIWVLIGLIALHILGALKHQFIDRLKFIQRMQ